MHYCLNKAELHELVAFKKDNIEPQNESLKIRVDGSECWQDELSCLSYLFSQILLNKSHDEDYCKAIIDLMYDLENQMLFSIQEFDYRFVEFMLMSLRNPSLSLEEELVELQNSVAEYRYGDTLRY